MKLPEIGMSHYDEPPPDRLGNLDGLRQMDRFRFANELTGWIEVEDGKIVGHGQAGSGHIGSTTLRAPAGRPPSRRSHSRTSRLSPRSPTPR